MTAVHYSLAAAEARKADTVALEECLDDQRRDMVTQIYKLHSQQRRMLARASPTRHVARLGAGPVPGGDLSVPARRPPKWKDAYPHLSTQAAEYSERSAARRREAAAVHANKSALAQAQEKARAAEAARRTARLRETHVKHGPGSSQAVASSAAAGGPMASPGLTRPSSAPQLALRSSVSTDGRPGSAMGALSRPSPSLVASRHLMITPSVGAVGGEQRRAAPVCTRAAHSPMHGEPVQRHHEGDPSATGVVGLLNVRWRPAPSSPTQLLHATSTSTGIAAYRTPAPSSIDAWGVGPGSSSRSADGGVSSVGPHGGVGGAVGQAIAAELEERASMARSQQLVVDNERMRKEAAITLYEDALHFPYDRHKGHGGNSADGPTEEEHALASPSDAAGKSFAPRVLASSASHRRQQLAARARRILREAVRLRLANDASSSVHAWALGGLSMSKLAKVALEIAKVSDALRGSEFFADLYACEAWNPCIPSPTCCATMMTRLAGLFSGESASWL